MRCNCPAGKWSRFSSSSMPSRGGVLRAAMAMAVAVLLVTGLGTLSKPAAASPNSANIAVDVLLGKTKFSGGLATTTPGTAAGFGVAVGYLDWPQSTFTNAMGGFSSFWQLQFLTISGRTQYIPRFPFQGSRDFTATADSFAPNFCALGHFPVQICLGIGWEQLEVMQGSDYDQTYGTFAPSLAIGRWLTPGVNGGLKVDYRSQQQIIAGNKSHFNAFSVLAVLGWEFSLGD